MPLYEFFCRDCKKPFSKYLSVAEYEKGKTACPKCDRRNVEQRLSSGYAITSKKSA
jgi:putative FmdB family regulatory protein